MSQLMRCSKPLNINKLTNENRVSVRYAHAECMRPRWRYDDRPLWKYYEEKAKSAFVFVYFWLVASVVSIDQPTKVVEFRKTYRGSYYPHFQNLATPLHKHGAKS